MISANALGTRPGYFIPVLALIVAFSAVPRLLISQYSLPFIDHPDEPRKYLEVLDWRGIIDQGDYYDGYPPGYIAVSYVAQVIGSPLGLDGPSEQIGVLRVVSALMSLVTLVFIALSARLAAGDYAGWIAGVAWGISEYIVINSITAIQDPFVYLFTSIAIWLASIAWVDESRIQYCLWSVLVGIIAIVFKYSAIAALAPGAIVAMLYMLREPRRNWRYVAAQAAVVLPTALWVIRQAEALRGWQRHANDAATRGLQGLLMFQDVISNWRHAILPLGPVAFLAFLVLGMAAFVYARFSSLPGIKANLAALSAAVLVIHPWLVTIFVRVEPHRIRDVLPASVAACILLGIAAEQIVMLFYQTAFRATLASVGTLLVMGTTIFIPQGIGTWHVVEDRVRPDRRIDIANWADLTLEPGPYVSDRDNHTIFNRIYGGYTGQNEFALHEIAFVDDSPVETWRRNGAIYAFVPYWYYEQMKETSLGRAYLDQLTLLRVFEPNEAFRGPSTAIFRLYPIQYPVVSSAGPIQLAGYEIDKTQVGSGGELYFRHYWQAIQTPDRDFSVYNHLVPIDSREVMAQIDGTPLQSGRRPTTSWDDPEEILVGQLFRLVLPTDLPPGDYRLTTGFYDPATGQRLVLSDGNDYYDLSVITVSE